MSELRVKDVNNNWRKIAFTEEVGEKVTTISSSSTDDQYPSAKAVNTFVEGKGYITEHQDISGKENTSNRVTSISSSSTNTQYPTAKAVYDYVQSAISIYDGGVVNI